MAAYRGGVSEETNGRTGRVLVLVLPEVNLLDLGGPVQVFDAAAHLGGGYRLEFVAETDGLRSAQGLRLAGLAPLSTSRAAAGDLVLVPGPRLTGSDRPVTPAVVRWVREAHDAGARVASVCSGAVVLGEAGLLDGRACTTHWSLTSAMRDRYPRARVREAALYVHDGRISTSAGISSGIDLALSLVERERGPNWPRESRVSWCCTCGGTGTRHRSVRSCGTATTSSPRCTGCRTIWRSIWTSPSPCVNSQASPGCPRAV